MNYLDTNHKMYLMFSKSNTILSKIIYILTKEKYTHVALSTDGSFKDFYSFGRRHYRFLLPAGFVKESPFRGMYKKDKNIQIKIASIDIDKEQYKNINEQMIKMYEDRFKYKYSIMGIVLFKLALNVNRKRHKFCSEFVGEVLKENNVLNIKQTRPVSPMCLSENIELNTVFEGTVEEFFIMYNEEIQQNYMESKLKMA